LRARFSRYGYPVIWEEVIVVETKFKQVKDKTLYAGLADTLGQLIAKGAIKSGEKLPSIRTVSKAYGVSKNTVIQAYLVLESRSLIHSRPQSGFYVSGEAKRVLPVPTISSPGQEAPPKEADGLIGKVFQNLNNNSITQLSLSVPDQSFLPVAKLNKSMVAAIRALPGGGTAYGDIQGNARLRNYIAKWSFTWGGNLGMDDIVTTAGAMNAISFGLMALTKPGDTIAVESPVYYGILQLAKHLGLKVLELPTHPVTGIDVNGLREIVHSIRLCLLVSNFNNPLGSCMPDEQKKQVVALLTEAQVPLIEDDLYGDVYFGDKRPKPCKAYDKAGIVLWCGSFSKTLAPGYRVGWIAPGKFIKNILRQKAFHSISSTALTQEATAHFLENGWYEKHLSQLRKKLFHNSQQFIRSLGEYFPEGTKVSRPQGGFVLWVELGNSINTAALYEKAMAHGISIAPGRMFTLQDQFHHCMRLSYGLEWNERLEEKLKTLGKLVAQ